MSNDLSIKLFFANANLMYRQMYYCTWFQSMQCGWLWFISTHRLQLSSLVSLVIKQTIQEMKEHAACDSWQTHVILFGTPIPCSGFGSSKLVNQLVRRWFAGPICFGSRCWVIHNAMSVAALYTQDDFSISACYTRPNPSVLFCHSTAQRNSWSLCKRASPSLCFSYVQVSWG